MSDSQLTSLFNSAESDGILDAGASSILINNQDEIMVAGARGVDAEQLLSGSYTIVTVLVDKSSSIAYSGLEQDIRDGVNEMVNSLCGSKERDEILLSVWSFNGQQDIVHAFVDLNNTVRLDGNNYNGTGCTSLYDTYIKAVGSNLAYAQDLRDNEGATVRSVVIIFTDGEDTSSKSSAGDCNVVTKKAMASETLITAFIGVGNDAYFSDIAKNMGIPDNCILVEQNMDGSAIRRVFQVLSESIIKTSQGQVSPGQNAGFFDN